MLNFLKNSGRKLLEALRRIDDDTKAIVYVGLIYVGVFVCSMLMSLICLYYVLRIRF